MLNDPDPYLYPPRDYDAPSPREYEGDDVVTFVLRYDVFVPAEEDFLLRGHGGAIHSDDSDLPF